MALFRKQVLDHRSQKLTGDVLMTVPLSWSIVNALIFVSVLAALTFLAIARYPRIEVAAGVLVPNKGVPSIVASRSGIIARIYVSERDHVKSGAPLAEIRVEEDDANGETIPVRIAEAMRRQRNSLLEQIAAGSSATRAQVGQLLMQKASVQSDILQLKIQVGLQERLVQTAKNDLDRASRIFERGFLSQKDLDARQDALLSRQQALSQLVQNAAAKVTQIVELDRNIEEIRNREAAQSASLRAAIAGISQQSASAVGSRGYLLRSPIPGRVSAITVRLGQAVDRQTMLMTIVPDKSQLLAELAVPTTAIGFIHPGQKVRIAVDAYPYQTFGTFSGKVTFVSGSALPISNGPPSAVTAYLVRVKLDSETIRAFGRTERLQPGMTLAARIVTEDRSIIEWLFEPIFAVRSR